jgi:hypothetical protein
MEDIILGKRKNYVPMEVDSVENDDKSKKSKSMSDDELIKELSSLKINDNKSRIRKIHEGYPMIPFGHPRLCMAVCAYPLCGKKFKSAEELKRHILDVFEIEEDDVEFNMAELHRYACGYESYESKYYNKKTDKYKVNYKLTPSLIMKNNITKCPVYKCPDNHKIHTAIDLINHFVSYSVETFILTHNHLDYYS